jgi:thiol:disulfide interchange protein DsbD
MNRAVLTVVMLGCLGLGFSRAGDPAQESAPLVKTSADAPQEGEQEAEEGDPMVQRLKERLLDALKKESTSWALLIAFLAGLLTSLMGCVYPLIPVVVAVIGARETRSKLGALGISGVYVLGMCVLYTALGLIFAGLGRVFGSWMSSVWIVGFIVVFFVVMGLAMAKIINLELLLYPLQQRLGRVGGRGVAGAFLAGLVSGLVMAPCTGPVLSVILVFIAKSQSFFFGFWLLFLFSLGAGFLFLVVGTFSGIVAHLPRSGVWMEVIQTSFAMIMIGMALYFLRGVSATWHQAALDVPFPGWMGLGVVGLAALCGGFHLSFPGGSALQRARKGIGLALGSAGVFLLAVSLFMGASNVEWHKDLDSGLRMAKQQKKPVMIDFWATWCKACIDLDRDTFSDPAVRDELRRFVCIKLDCTDSAEDEKLTRVMERHGAMDLPTVRFVDGQGKLLDRPVLKGFVGPGPMLRLLKRIR